MPVATYLFPRGDFEDVGQWTATGAVLASAETAHVTDGKAALRIVPTGTAVVESAEFGPANLGTVTDRLALDVLVEQVNASAWVGDIQLTATCVDEGLHGHLIGNIHLADLPTGQFQTVEFRVPDRVLSAWQGGADDCTLAFEISAFRTTGPVVIDHLTFH